MYRIIPASLAVGLLAAATPSPAVEKVFRYAFNAAETDFDPAEASDLYSSNLLPNVFDAPLACDHRDETVAQEKDRS